jgi:hypothetical protein
MSHAWSTITMIRLTVCYGEELPATRPARASHLTAHSISRLGSTFPFPLIRSDEREIERLILRFTRQVIESWRLDYNTRRPRTSHAPRRHGASSFDREEVGFTNTMQPPSFLHTAAKLRSWLCDTVSASFLRRSFLSRPSWRSSRPTVLRTASHRYTQSCLVKAWTTPVRRIRS